MLITENENQRYSSQKSIEENSQDGSMQGSVDGLQKDYV